MVINMDSWKLKKYHKRSGDIIWWLMFILIVISSDSTPYAVFGMLILLPYILITFYFFEKIDDDTNPLDDVHRKLINRYSIMFLENTNAIYFSRQTEQNPIQDEVDNLYWMIYDLKKNYKTFPIDKTSRWIGYIQRCLIEKDVTTVQIERDFSRPLFHAAYRHMGMEIPKTKKRERKVNETHNVV